MCTYESLAKDLESGATIKVVNEDTMSTVDKRAIYGLYHLLSGDPKKVALLISTNCNAKVKSHPAKS